MTVIAKCSTKIWKLIDEPLFQSEPLDEVNLDNLLAVIDEKMEEEMSETKIMGSQGKIAWLQVHVTLEVLREETDYPLKSIH